LPFEGIFRGKSIWECLEKLWDNTTNLCIALLPKVVKWLLVFTNAWNDFIYIHTHTHTHMHVCFIIIFNVSIIYNLFNDFGINIFMKNASWSMGSHFE
jgi:hypothetical protein